VPCEEVSHLFAQRSGPMDATLQTDSNGPKSTQVAHNDPMNIHGSSGWTSQMIQMSVLGISMDCPNDRPIDAVKGLSHVHPWDGHPVGTNI